MTQSRKTIESVWATKGNLPSSAIVSTADGKYPALDGSLITNVGDLLAANNLSEITATASVARTNLGLGAADTVEFGAFIPPSGTTAEIDAVTTATVGQVMVDTDTKQIVRFTGAATYVRIGSSAFEPTIGKTPDAALTLTESRLFESGLVLGSSSFTPSSTIKIKGTKNPSEDTGDVSYFYYTGSAVGGAGWRQVGASPASIVDNNAVIVPDTLLQYVENGVDSTPFSFNKYSINTQSDVIFASSPLKLGVTYSFDFQVNYLDLLAGNFGIEVSYSGLFATSGHLQFTNTDSRLRSGLVDLTVNDPDVTTTIYLGTGTFSGAAGSKFGQWSIKGKITPSSDGVLTISGKPLALSVEPILHSTPSMTITALAN